MITTVGDGMSDAQYRVAVIGVAHMHINELMRRFAGLPNVQIVAVADTGLPELNQSSPSTRAHTLGVARSEIGISHVRTMRTSGSCSIESDPISCSCVPSSPTRLRSARSCPAGGQSVRSENGLDPPAHRATLALEFLHHLETGDPLHPC